MHSIRNECSKYGSDIFQSNHPNKIIIIVIKLTKAFLKRKRLLKVKVNGQQIRAL